MPLHNAVDNPGSEVEAFFNQGFLSAWVVSPFPNIENYSHSDDFGMYMMGSEL